MGDQIIGLVLIDCSDNNSEIVAKRIENKVASAKITIQKDVFKGLAINSVFMQMNNNIEISEMFDACENALIEQSFS